MSIIKHAKGIITSYRRGRHRVHPTQVLCKFSGFDDAASAAKLIGHEMEWISEHGTSIKGKITRTHGDNGVVRVQLLGKGLPGQAIGTGITIVK